MAGSDEPRALFLDRDGVINRDPGYLHRIEDFVFLDGVFAACRRAWAMGYRLVIVTNQSGIGRGLYDEAAFTSLTEWMCGRFREEGVEIAAVYHDPTHPVAGQGAWRRASPDRKPAPGMLLRARDDLGI
ncbi:MAG: HAD-IIIA family hydrolase, partial [Alphaproteobacteria bacterium]|nr:HAD-IIIA family hydrolase [Alphaproteobacteria bacterium]